MKKTLIFVLCVLFFNSLLALNIQVEKLSSGEVMIPELNEPAEFQLKITNYDSDQKINFYNLAGFNMEPSEGIFLKKGETKVVNLKIYSIGEFKTRGEFIMNYYIKGSKDDSVIKDSLLFSILDLEDVFEIGSSEIDNDKQYINVYVRNKVNKKFKNINVIFNSTFFNINENFDIGEYSIKTFNINLDRENFKKLNAGFYTFKTKIIIQGVSAEFENAFNYPRYNQIEETKREYGFLIHNTIIKKENKGNIAYVTEEIIQKNIISRLVTSFSPEPDIVNRDGFKVIYFWKRSLNPGESLEINITTNWILPLVVLFLIILIVALTKLYSKKEIELKKKISFIKAKGGEFALRVNIYVHARKHVDRVNVIDRLPPLVKLYGKFGAEKPSRFNEKSRMLEWNFDSIEKGETRILSYVVYSKIGVLGKFSLPSATAIYEDDGKVKECSSNRAFFVTEALSKKIEEE